MFLEKVVLKIGSKFTGENTCQSAISIKLQSSVIEITFRYGCSSVNLMHIFRTPFSKNTSGWLLLCFDEKKRFGLKGLLFRVKFLVLRVIFSEYGIAFLK